MAKQSKRRQSPVSRAPEARPAAVSTFALVSVALVLVTLAIYWQVRTHEFVDIDDTIYVVDNPQVRGGLSSPNLKWAFTTDTAANWHPLTWLSHQLDVTLFGMAPGMHHMVSVFWHVLNTLLLFACLRFMTGALWRSAFVAALFAVHPTHVESVAWVAERKDVLSTCFWIGSMWAYAAWVRKPDWWRYALSVALLAIGLMAKPMLMTLPFVLLLLDIWPLRRTTVPWTRRVAEKIPFFVLTMASALVTVNFQQRGGAVGTLELITAGDRAANAIVSYGRYLRSLVWPTDLSVFYPYEMDLGFMRIAVAAAVVLALTALAWRVRASQPAVLVGWLWFLGTLVPVIGLVQVGMQSHADRYTYIPYIGLFIGIAWGGRALALRAHIGPSFLRVVAAAIVIALATMAHTQAATWVTREGIWLQALNVNENNARAHNALGAVYGNRGETEAAIVEFREALRLRPDMTEARDIYANLGKALLSSGKAEDALPYLERARDLNPARADVRNDLALASFALKRTEEALASWREAVRLNPRFEQAFYMMGMVLAGEQRIDEARRAFSEVLRINPARKDAQDALAALGRR